MKEVISYRIKNLRRLHALTLAEFAERIGVTKQMVSKYEKGLSIPGSEVLLELSKEFNQKLDYFFRKADIEIGEINFRKKSALGTKHLNSLKEKVRIQIENYLFVENICGISSKFVNPIREHQILSTADVQKAAFQLKNYWNIGQDAIYNVIDHLESNHIKVIELDDDSGKFDGLATVVDQQYHIIVVTKHMPVERKRFTLLHELGHLLLPISEFEPKQQEKFCNDFASEMLLSIDNIKTEFSAKRHQIFFNELVHIQEKYGISISAIMMKLNQTNIINDAKLRHFFMKLNTNEDLKKNVDASRYQGEELSNRFENLVYRAISEEQISMSKASSLLQVDLSSLKKTLSQNVF